MPTNSSHVLTVGLNEINIGIGNGWVSPILDQLHSNSSELQVNSDESSWIASLDSIGRIVGAILSALFIDIVGRKSILGSCAIIFLLNWLAILFTKSVPIIYIVRLSFGLAKGMNDLSNSVYVGENTSPVFRGVFGTVASMCYYGALVGEYAVATFLTYNAIACINASIGLLTVSTIFCMKEPVQFLMMKGKNKKAEKNFLWLKGAKNLDSVATEWERIKENVQLERSKKSSFSELVTSSANYKSLLIVVTTYFLVGAMGFAPVIAYTSTAFASTKAISSNQFTILFGLLQFIVAILASFFISSFNRRSIIITSSILIAITHLCTACLYYYNAYIAEVPYFAWLIFSSITLFASIYSFMYPAIFLIRSELFPLSVKAIGVSASLIANSGMSFLTTKVFLLISETYGIYVNFIAFSVVCTITAVFVYLTLPETRNKSLIEIQNALENKRYDYNEVAQLES